MTPHNPSARRRLPHLRPSAYPLLVRVLEEEVAYGVRHAYKHSAAKDTPSDDDLQRIINTVIDACLNGLCDAFRMT